MYKKTYPRRMKRIYAYMTFEIILLFGISGTTSTPISNSTSQFKLQITTNANSSNVPPLIVPTNEGVSGGKAELLNSNSVSNGTNELLHKQESQESVQIPADLELESQETSSKVASEVDDLLNRNSANDTSIPRGDNDEDDSVNIKDIIIVKNPKVKDEGKTHDNDSKVDGTLIVINNTTSTVNNETVNLQYLRDNITTIYDNAQMDTNVSHTIPNVETFKNTTLIGNTIEHFTVPTENINTIIMTHNTSFDDKMKDESQIIGCGNNGNNKEVNTSVQICNSTIPQIHINSTSGSDQQNNSANNIAVLTKVPKKEQSQSHIKSDIKPTNKDLATTDGVFPTENLLDMGDTNSPNLQHIENKEDHENHSSDIKTDRSPGTSVTTGNVITAPPSPQSFASLQQAESGARGKSGAFLQPTESAAILAGVFVAIALFGYVGLLVWRQILEKRYGNREMLVNEDDFYDTSDLRHFEL